MTFIRLFIYMKKQTLFILFVFVTHVSLAQYTISGRVLDERELPLQGVSVMTADSAVHAITDSAGKYSFQSSSALIYLSFTYVGYLSKTILINGQPPVITLYRNDIFLPGTIVQSFARNSHIQNIPAAVTVLNKAAIDKYGSESLVPAVNSVPGVKMDERSPGSYRLSIRGNLLRSTFGVRNVKIYWNGIPLTDANGTTYLNELPFNSIDKIEILKGPSGSMYGAGTGGVVLLGTDLNQSKGKNVSVMVSGGNNDMLAVNAAYQQNTVKNNSSLAVSHLQSGGYRAHTDMRRDVAHLTSTYFISQKQQVHANIFYSDLYYQTPGALTMAELSLDPKQARPAAGVFESAEAQKAALYLRTFYAGFANELRFNKKWDNITSVYFSNTNFRNPTIRNYERKREAGIGIRSVTQYKKNIFTATIGAEYQYGFTDAATFGNRFGSRDSLQFQDEIDARQFNIFLQGDISLQENIILNAGISYNNFHYGFTRLSEFPLVDESSAFKPNLVPRISVLKKIKKQLSIYVSVSKGFSPPSIDEVRGGNDQFNKKLEAETGINYEAGIKGNIIRNKCWFDMCYYFFSLQHTIVSRRDSGGGDYFVNAGKTRQQGFETSLNFMVLNNEHRFFRQLKFWGSYTNNYARFVNYQQGNIKYDGNKLTGTAPNIISAGADINTASRIYANLTYHFTDQIPLNDANSFFAGSYSLVFLKIGYKIPLGKKTGADIFISYDRSFDEPYSLGNDLNAAGSRFYNPTSPQNFYAGVRVKYQLGNQ